ncbi:MAG TPA: RNA polymerase sigma factor [Polyangiaceae bacterium]|nr:RNA polymerase sigma factor [Polyangiaceae bacterium]
MPPSHASYPAVLRPRSPGPFSEPGRAAALAKAAAEGDVTATREFLTNVSPALHRVVTSVLGAKHPDREDVVQQAMIALVHALAAFRGECHPVGYASRIALHVALRARRRARVERGHQETLERLSREFEEPHADPDDGMAERRRRALRDLLEELPEEQADALALRVMLGWSLEETADAAGAPVNTIRSRVRLAKQALRKRIEANPELFDDLEVLP